MAHTIKALTKLVEIETGVEWRVERRTRGKDAIGTEPGKIVQTWIVILVNAFGHKQFVPEARIWESFRPQDAKVAEPKTGDVTV